MTAGLGEKREDGRAERTYKLEGTATLYPRNLRSCFSNMPRSLIVMLRKMDMKSTFHTAKSSHTV